MDEAKEVGGLILFDISRLLKELDMLENDIKDFSDYKEKYLKLLNLNKKIDTKHVDKALARFYRSKRIKKELKKLLNIVENKKVTMEIIKYRIKNVLNESLKHNNKSVLKEDNVISSFLELMKINNANEFFDNFFELIDSMFYVSNRDGIKEIEKSIIFNLTFDAIVNFEFTFTEMLAQQIINVSEIYKQIFEKISKNESIDKNIIRKINLQSSYIKICTPNILKSLLEEINIYNDEIKVKTSDKKEENQLPTEKPAYKFDLEVKAPTREERKKFHGEKQTKKVTYTDAEAQTLTGKPLEHLNELYALFCEALCNKEEYKDVVNDLPSYLEHLEPSTKAIVITKLIAMLDKNPDLNPDWKTTIVKRLGQIKN